jgi:hypothetical protein
MDRVRLVLVIFVPLANNETVSDIGKPCDQHSDCASELECDIHDRQGTCPQTHAGTGNEEALSDLRALWQVIGLASFEQLPAGSAVDVSASAQAGYRFFGKLSPAVGALADMRVLNVCTRPGGDREVCTDSRAGEKD